MLPKQQSSEIKHCCVEVKKEILSDRNKTHDPITGVCRPAPLFWTGVWKREAPVIGAPVVTSRLSVAEASVLGCGALLHPSQIKAGSSYESGPLMRTRLCTNWGHSTAGVGKHSPPGLGPGLVLCPTRQKMPSTCRIENPASIRLSRTGFFHISVSVWVCVCVCVRANVCIGVHIWGVQEQEVTKM